MEQIISFQSPIGKISDGVIKHFTSGIKRWDTIQSHTTPDTINQAYNWVNQLISTLHYDCQKLDNEYILHPAYPERLTTNLLGRFEELMNSSSLEKDIVRFEFERTGLAATLDRLSSDVANFNSMLDANVERHINTRNESEETNRLLIGSLRLERKNSIKRIQEIQRTLNNCKNKIEVEIRRHRTVQ